jgi:transposase
MSCGTVRCQRYLCFMLRYRYRVYPTIDQTADIGRLFGCVRVAYNDALAIRKTHHAATGAHLPTNVVSAALTASKRTPEREWLNEVSSVPLQQALADLDTAYRNFFSPAAGTRKGRKAGPPRFRKKTASGSARFTSNARFRVRQVNTGKAVLTLPKIGDLRLAYSRPLPAAPRSVTLIREADRRYYASFVVNPEPGTAAAQARARVAKLHAKTRELRQDSTRKIAVRLARENQAVAAETLNITGLARTSLAKSVHDAGWGVFITELTHAGLKYGCTVLGVSPWEPVGAWCAPHAGSRTARSRCRSEPGPAAIVALSSTATTTQP